MGKSKKFFRACSNGNLIKAQKIYEIDNYVYNNYTFTIARDNNDHIIRHDITKLVDYYWSESTHTFAIACMNGHLSVATWLYQLQPNCPIRNKSAFNLTCVTGHIDILKWLYHIDSKIIINNNDAFILCCAHGHKKIADWLIKKGVNIYDNNNIAFLYACKYGQLEIAQWLYSLNVEIKNEENHTIIYVCQEGHLELAKWLYSIYAILFNNYTILYMACRYKRYEIIEWLCSLEIPDLIKDYEMEFESVCSNGDIKIAQILQKTNLNIHVNDECVFRKVCKRGHLEIAKWLYELNVNIHAKNEYAFRKACKFEQIEIVKWLYQFNIELKYINFIPSIIILKDVFQLNNKNIKLFKAILKNNLDKIQKAIEIGADYDTLNDFAFYKSCYDNNLQVVVYLSKLEIKYYYEIDTNNKIINYEKIKLSKNSRNI